MTTPNNSLFLSKKNLSVLFEVIVDEYKKYISDKNEFNVAFNEMVQMFYYNQIKSGLQYTHDIVTMNKKFISFISSRLEQKFNIQRQQKHQRNTGLNNSYNDGNNINRNNESVIKTNNNIKSNNVEVQPVTSQDIKNERLEKFDKELSIKQNEFKNAFNNNIPEMPNFTSPLDEPISEMDILTKQKLAERESEIESIYNNINNGIKNDKNDIDITMTESNDWLQYFSSPIEKKETNISAIMKSIKIKEEIPKQVVVNEEIVLQQNRENDFKSIPKKNISWSDEKGLREESSFIKIRILDNPLYPTNTNTNTNNNKNNIFSKLKKIEGSDQNEMDVLTPIPAKVIDSVSEPLKYDSDVIARMENKIDKLTGDINKCYDVITLLFNTVMSSTNSTTNDIKSKTPE